MLSFVYGPALTSTIIWCDYYTWLLQKPCCLVAQSCPMFCNLMDCSLPGSSIHGILQARILKWVASPFSRTGKTTALTIWTFVYKIMSLLFNMMSRFVIAFLPRSKYLLISWLKSPSVVILEPKKINLSLFPLFPLLFVMKWWGRMPQSYFCNVEFLASFFTLLFHLHQQAL